MVSPSKLALLRDVAQSIIDSGYAEYPARRKAQHVYREDAMYAISIDPRLHSKARHTQASLIEDVMEMLNVKRPNAKTIIHRARKVERDWSIDAL